MTSLFTGYRRRPGTPPSPPVARVSWLNGSALGFGAALLLITAEAALGAAHWPMLALALPALLLVAVGAVTTLPGALLAAAQAWGLYAGFVLGHAGQLELSTRSGLAAGVLVAAAVAGSLGGLLATARAKRAAGWRGGAWAADPALMPVQRASTC